MVQARVLHPEHGEQDRFSLGEKVRLVLEAGDRETRIRVKQGPVLYSDPLRDWGENKSVLMLPECPGPYQLIIDWRPARATQFDDASETGQCVVSFVVDSIAPQVFLPTRRSIDEETTLWVPSTWEASLMQTAEQGMLDELAHIVSRDAVVYDVGANLGQYSIALARLANAGEVFCFEANPVCIHYLRANLAENQISNATILPGALLDKATTTPFRIHYGNSNIGVAEPSEFFNQKSGHEIHANARALDDLVESVPLPPPDVIKLDVEGAENLVIAGMTKTLRAHKPSLILELHGEDCARDVSTQLTDLGYTFRLPATERIHQTADSLIEAAGIGVFQVLAAPNP